MDSNGILMLSKDLWSAGGRRRDENWCVEPKGIKYGRIVRLGIDPNVVVDHSVSSSEELDVEGIEIRSAA